MISLTEVQTKLEGYPDQVIRCYVAFLNDRDPQQLTGFIVGLIEFMQDTGNTGKGIILTDETELQADLGVDSITIAEVVFLLEDIFEIEIENQDVTEITNIGKMRQYVLERLKSMD